MEPVAYVPSHRALAMLRGEHEALLSVHIAPPAGQAIAILDLMFVTSENGASQVTQWTNVNCVPK